MNPRHHLCLLALAAGALLLATAARAKPLSDLVSPDKRRQSVERAQRFAKPAPIPALPAGLPLPFDPPGFDQPDPEEVRAAQTAAAAALAAGLPPASAISGQPAIVKTSTDRDLLAAMAPQIKPSGTFVLGGEPLLMIGKNRFKVGDHFTVIYEKEEHELELTAIDRTTFTLRLRQEEITRPIQPGKKP